MIDAILLASGKGRRFGGNKLLAPYKGKELARWTLDLVRACKLFHGIFFVAAYPETAALAWGMSGVTVIHNSHAEYGRRESIRLGVSASNAAYFMFFPCDQPFLDAETVRRVAAARAPRAICRPEFRGRPGNPALFAADFRAELCALREGETGRDIILRHPQALIRVEASGARALDDIDYRWQLEEAGADYSFPAL